MTPPRSDLWVVPPNSSSSSSLSVADTHQTETLHLSLWTGLSSSDRSGTPPVFYPVRLAGPICRILKVLRLGHCCKIWAVVSVACFKKRQSGVFSVLNFECMCCLSLLCPVLRRKIVTCSGRVSRWYWFPPNWCYWVVTSLRCSLLYCC